MLLPGGAQCLVQCPIRSTTGSAASTAATPPAFVRRTVRSDRAWESSFLLGNLHLLSWARLERGLRTTGPLLLILWGVIKLIEHQQAHAMAFRHAASVPEESFLVIVIVVCGSSPPKASRFNWGEIRDNMNIDDSDLDNIFGQTYNFDDPRTGVPSSATGLRVNNDHGAGSRQHGE